MGAIDAINREILTAAQGKMLCCLSCSFLVASHTAHQLSIFIALWLQENEAVVMLRRRVRKKLAEAEISKL